MWQYGNRECDIRTKDRTIPDALSEPTDRAEPRTALSGSFACVVGILRPSVGNTVGANARRPFNPSLDRSIQVIDNELVGCRLLSDIGRGMSHVCELDVLEIVILFVAKFKHPVTEDP